MVLLAVIVDTAILPVFYYGTYTAPSRMEAVREIQSFAEHQALVLLGTIWMRHPLLCLSGAKLRLK